jgi:hypothetical protein
MASVRRQFPSADKKSAKESKVLSRRDVLKGGVGVTLLACTSELLLRRRTTVTATGFDPTLSADLASPFFVYGLTNESPPVTLEMGTTANLSQPLTVVAQPLAAPPVRSLDGSRLASVSVSDQVGDTMKVTVTLIDYLTGSPVSSGILPVSGLPAGTLLLVTPTLAPDDNTVGLGLSISVPTNPRTATKFNVQSGETMTIQAVTWVSHHEVAFFDGANSTFSGPYDLGDAPSLARVNIVADASDLYVWTVPDLSVLVASGTEVPSALTTTLRVFPLGSATPRLSLPAPGPWPVNSEPLLALSTGGAARMIYARQLQVYDPTTGQATTYDYPDLAVVKSAKPGTPDLRLNSDGTLLLTNPASGAAVFVDPAQSYAVVASVTFPIPLTISGAASKVALSGDCSTLYTLGPSGAGGLSAYDIQTNTLVASYSDGDEYAGVYCLGSGSLVALDRSSATLIFFSPALDPVGEASPGLYVSRIY